MGADQAMDLMRGLFKEAFILSAPLLVAALMTSFVISLLQTLTSLQDQAISTVPRLLIVAGLVLAGMPW